MEKTPRPTRKKGEKTKIPLCSFFSYSSGPTCQIIKLGTSPLCFVVLSVPACRKAKKDHHCHHLPPAELCSVFAVWRFAKFNGSGCADMINQSIGQPFFCLCSRRKKLRFFSVPSSDNFSTSPLFLRLQGRALCIVRNIRC